MTAEETSTIQSDDVTSQEVTETNDTVETTTSQETETNSTTSEATETDETEQTKDVTSSIDYEKQYKELQAAYTKGQQELAELRKQVPGQPQIVNEQGQVNPQFEQQFNHEVENYEFSQYQALAARLDAEQMPHVMQLLNQANQAYSMGDINAYRGIMSRVKYEFDPRYVEQIATQRANLEAQKGERINQAMYEQRMQAGANLEANLRQNAEVWELVNPESENYSPEVFNVVKQMFDSYGAINTNALANVIKAIETNGVRKHNAALEAQKTAEMNKGKANISTGEGVAIKSGNPTDLNSEEYWNKYYN